MNDTPRVIGHQTYVVTIGEKVSVSLKPLRESGPLMTLDEEGRWFSKPKNTFYKIDSNGARWSWEVKKKDQRMLFPKYVSDNTLAVLTDMNERDELSNTKLKDARFRAKKGAWVFLASLTSHGPTREERVEAAKSALGIE